MKVSVVVPAFNEEKELAASLSSIRAAMGALDRQGWESELIVCDNNSTDHTAEIARAAGATVVFEPVNQISRARNTGAAAATGDWLVFVDADSHPSRELFADVTAAILGGRCLAGGATVSLGDADLLPRLVVATWNAVSSMTRWAAGAFMFCETAAFREIGGFSEALYAAEEIDLFRRLKRLARRRGRSILILARHPIVTSDRKAHLYSHGEHVGFLIRTLLGAGRTLKSAEGASTWYDGRR